MLHMHFNEISDSQTACNSGNDIEGHSRSLVMTQCHAWLLLVFHGNVSVLFMC